MLDLGGTASTHEGVDPPMIPPRESCWGCRERERHMQSETRGRKTTDNGRPIRRLHEPTSMYALPVSLLFLFFLVRSDWGDKVFVGEFRGQEKNPHSESESATGL